MSHAAEAGSGNGGPGVGGVRDSRSGPPATPTLLSWSTGKDAAYALQVLRAEGRFEVVGLLTTVTEPFGRVAMHGVRVELLEAQALAVGVPLVQVPLPHPCSDAEYDRRMSRVLEAARGRGIRHVAFGDLFLEDIRRYREDRLRPVGMEGLFPLWGRATPALAREMIAAGVRARVASLDPRHLDRSFAGREFDATMLADLPADVDPCGERGEFHTFATDGPAFAHPVPVDVGPVVDRDGFVFADLRPRAAGGPAPT